MFLIPFNQNDLTLFPNNFHKLLIESKVNVVSYIFFLWYDNEYFLLSFLLFEYDIEASDAIQLFLIISVPTTVSLKNL